MKISEKVRQMSPPRYTTAQAAALVGRSDDTLRRWRGGPNPTFNPSEEAEFGSLVVPLYSGEDIKEMKRISKTMKPGRKKKTV